MTVLNPLDLVGLSFFVTSMALLASTVFFFLERFSVKAKWHTSLTVAGLITGIAFIHYLYMRGVWIAGFGSPLTYRYVDWFITVPLQIVEFYLILKIIGKTPVSLFWKLLTASVVMLVAGYVGEAGLAPELHSFIIGMVAWLYILYEIFFGEGGSLSSKGKNYSAKLAYTSLKWLVTIGWAIYPIGYLFGMYGGESGSDMLNITYNLADFVNKIAFGLIIWAAAKKESAQASFSRPKR
tara:strand:- start:150 stop:863 length:714 start_codon:yes stop_codon:yes gene_type:complete